MFGRAGRGGSMAQFVHTPPQRSRSGHRIPGTWACLTARCSRIASRRECHGFVEKSLRAPLAAPVPDRRQICCGRIWRRRRTIARHCPLHRFAGRPSNQCPGCASSQLWPQTASFESPGENSPRNRGEKFKRKARNRRTHITLTGWRRAKPPSPSPSIARR